MLVSGIELFAGSSEQDYEPDTSCPCMEHNKLLRRTRTQLSGRKRRRNEILRRRDRRGGRRPESLRAAACGGGGRYHFNLSLACGTAAVTACNDPSAYEIWDVVRLTEAAYDHVADGWLRRRPLS
ncbi:hypothetical protein ABZP36_026744 [Zizania latifolia]